MFQSLKIVMSFLLVFIFTFGNGQAIDSLNKESSVLDSVIVEQEADSLILLPPKPESLVSKIDSVIEDAIRQEAFPGCVIYASVGDSVVLLKSYGFHTYDSVRRVAVNDIYDIASVTKVTGATLAIMKLYDDGMINLDDPIGNYIEGIGKIGKTTIRECLAHQAGLRAWIPYYQEVRKKNGSYKRNTVGPQSESLTYSLTDSLYLHRDFYKKIKKMIRKSEISDEKTYRYSGLFFYLVPEMVEQLTGMSYEVYLNENFYNPLSTETLMFNPLDSFSKSQIVPTENDTYFRMEQIHGTVHDEGAITMKGVSGNAGLFSNVEDLAIVWRMFLADGSKDTTQFLRSETVQLFTSTQYPNNENRRGLGFDKPLLEYDSIRSSVAKDASFRSYGHSGYTGTLVWADPENDLLFIFLSNRVYPTRENRNLYRLNVRPTIHQLLYEMIK